MNRMTGAAAAVLCAALSEPSLAQTAPTPDVSQADTQAFVTQAARSTMLDLAAAKEAERKIRDPAVKTYAGQVIADDSRIEDGLKSFAERAGATFPNDLDEQRALELKDLESSDGAQLEQKFRSSQIGGNRQAIEIFQDFGRNARDPRMKSWVDDAVGTLRKHLEAATRLPLVPTAPQG